jgi:hypothetical protein
LGDDLRSLLVITVAMAALGCRAQVRARGDIDALSGSDPDASDRKYELAQSEAARTPPPGVAAPPKTGSSALPASAVVHDRTGFLGVTHDLSLASSAPRTPVCNCLTVAHGSPRDPKFAWQAEAPLVDAETIAIAIADDGVACASRGSASVRASISAVEREGNDIVVVVESARQGQPVMRGALAASPGPNGVLVIRGRNGAPYGAPPSGGPGPCRIALR